MTAPVFETSPEVTSVPWRDQPYVVALAGMASLAAAMGIGRFAFTPLLPMMLNDGVVTLAEGSWLAMSNYVGYLMGALLCMALPWVAPQWIRVWNAARMGRIGLAATVLLTLAMTLPLPAAWPALRWAAGVASALVFLNVSGWCMVRLTALGHPAMGGLIFCGPGLGIVVTGLSASGMVAAHWAAMAGWLSFGVLAALLTLVAWKVLTGHPEEASAAISATTASTEAINKTITSRVEPEVAEGPWDRALLTTAYGLAGLGYIVTATYLPVIARAALPAGSIWPDLFWPLFGAGVAMGALASTRTPAHWDRRVLLMAAYAIQAAAIVLTLLWPGRTGFAVGSWLLGLPFTALTFYALQEARRIWPAARDSFPGLLTVAYGLGQIAGPPMVAALLHSSTSESQGFAAGLGIAAGSLLLGALIYALMVRRQPLQRS